VQPNSAQWACNLYDPAPIEIDPAVWRYEPSRVLGFLSRLQPNIDPVKLAAGWLSRLAYWPPTGARPGLPYFKYNIRLEAAQLTCATINAFNASWFSVSRSGRAARSLILCAVCQAAKFMANQLLINSAYTASCGACVRTGRRQSIGNAAHFQHGSQL
jgi:hypothetical protein